VTVEARLHLSASLMCARLDALGDEVEALEAAGIDGFHLDVMDGHFVPNLALSVDTVAAVRARTSLPLEVHLMVAHPGRYLDALADARADLVFFHLETGDAPRTTAAIIERGMAAGIAVGPRTPLPRPSEVGPVGDVLVMAVEPGFAGGAWREETPGRVLDASRSFGAGTRIHVDGHADTETGPRSLLAGATGFVCGSSGLFGSDLPGHYAERLAALRAALVRGQRPAAVGVPA
jgi:ribulose-phosphate 3-epimerase